jgi:hypothetical protein
MLCEPFNSQFVYVTCKGGSIMPKHVAFITV